MKMETILNAMERADFERLWKEPISARKRKRRQYRAFRARILRMFAEKDQMIRDMAWLAYCDQVVDTGLENEMIGPGKEYFDKEDWIESWIDGLKEG